MKNTVYSSVWFKLDYHVLGVCGEIWSCGLRLTGLIQIRESWVKFGHLLRMEGTGCCGVQGVRLTNDGDTTNIRYSLLPIRFIVRRTEDGFRANWNLSRLTAQNQRNLGPGPIPPVRGCTFAAPRILKIQHFLYPFIRSTAYISCLRKPRNPKGLSLNTIWMHSLVFCSYYSYQ